MTRVAGGRASPGLIPILALLVNVSRTAGARALDAVAVFASQAPSAAASANGPPDMKRQIRASAS